MIAWKYKFGAMLLALIAAAYILTPTLLGLKDSRAELKKQGQELPWYYSVLPEKELNLGLDLRGGLYMELEVGMKEALVHQVGFLSGDIQRIVLADEEFKGSSVTQLPGNRIRVEVAENLKSKFKSELVRYFGNQVFNIENKKFELFYKINGDAKTIRKEVYSTLSKVPNYRPHLSFSHQDKYLAVGFEEDAQVSQIRSVMSGDGLMNQVMLQEVHDVVYLTLTDYQLALMNNNIIEQAANSVRNRIDRFGVAEASVSRQSADRLVVELPGVKDPDAVIDIIRRTGKLEFRIVSDQMSNSALASLISGKVEELKIDAKKIYEKENLDKLNEALKIDLPENTEVAYQLNRDRKNNVVVSAVPFLLEKNAEVTGEMLDNASVQSSNNMPYVSMVFNKTGAKKFGQLTSENVNRLLAIVLDGVVTSAPVIRSAINGGQAQIELGYGNYYDLQAEAKQLVLILKEGALPASLKVATKNIIGPSLGRESIEAGINSLGIAALAVLIFMLLYYKVGGVVANIALIMNVFFIFAVLTLFQASLTLPGIAGIVLTVGMAVDANVIIFERMREEMFLGRDPKTVVSSGYGNAMSAIIDGNITTFISGLVLFEFGTGPIKGFAATLMIGIATTLLTAIVFTRIMYDWLVSIKKVKELKI